MWCGETGIMSLYKIDRASWDCLSWGETEGRYTQTHGSETGLWLAEGYHVTMIMASDWRRQTRDVMQYYGEWETLQKVCPRANTPTPLYPLPLTQTLVSHNCQLFWILSQIPCTHASCIQYSFNFSSFESILFELDIIKHKTSSGCLVVSQPGKSLAGKSTDFDMEFFD